MSTYTYIDAPTPNMRVFEEMLYRLTEEARAGGATRREIAIVMVDTLQHELADWEAEKTYPCAKALEMLMRVVSATLCGLHLTGPDGVRYIFGKMGSGTAMLGQAIEKK
jgi:hypothetical protein